ncbi:hypothetical protein STSO111631_08450 [Stackebrandtia soli]
MPWLKRADCLARVDPLPLLHAGDDRFVGGAADSRVVDADDGTARHRTGERDRADAGRGHALTVGSREIHAPVPRAVPTVRLLESAQ